MIARHKERQVKKSGSGNPGYNKTGEVSKLRATLAAQKKLLAVKEAQANASELEAASKIIFDDDEDLDIQAALLQNYLLSLEENFVKIGAKTKGEFSCYTLATGLIYSGASATFVTSIEKFSNAMTHNTQFRTANGHKCYTAHAGKIELAIGEKSLHLYSLVAPAFGEDLIAVSQLTSKGNKFLFTKRECLFFRLSAALSVGLIIGTKGIENIYRLQANLTKTKSHKVLGAKLDLPRKYLEASGGWKIENKKNGPTIAPLVRDKHAHDTLNQTHRKIIEWFRMEFPDAMRHMENLSSTQSHKSCHPCSDGKVIREPLKKNDQNRYALLEALSSDTTDPMTPEDTEGNKYIHILVDTCPGWSYVQIMKKKNGARNAVIRSLTKIQRICDLKAKHLHTDGAKEHSTKEFRKILNDNGTETTHKEPNASQSNAFAERRFQQFMAAARTAMEAAEHMPDDMRSYAVIHASETGKYLPTAKMGKIQASSNAHIAQKCLGVKIAGPSCFMPWGKKWNISSADNFKKKLEGRAEDACNL